MGIYVWKTLVSALLPGLILQGRKYGAQKNKCFFKILLFFLNKIPWEALVLLEASLLNIWDIFQHTFLYLNVENKEYQDVKKLPKLVG